MNLRFHYKFIISIFVILLLLFGCFELPDELILPEWDTDINLPIANRRFTIDELIKEQGYIATDGLTIEDSIYVAETEAYKLDSDISDFIELVGFEPFNNIPVFTDSQSVTIYLQFPEGAEIDSAGFLSGEFNFNVENPTNAEVTLNLLFPGITDAANTPLLIEIITPPQGSASLNKELNDHKYKIPENQPPEFHNSLMITTAACNSNGSGEFVFMDFSTTDFMFSYVSGIMPATSLGTRDNTFGFATKLEDYRDKTIIREASLILDASLSNQLNDPYPVFVNNLNIVGLRSDGVQIMLKDSTGNSNMFINIENGALQKEFTHENSNVTEFVSFLPDTILLRAEYIMNPDNQRGSATIEDSVFFKTTFSMKSFVALKKSTVVDSSDIELTQEQRDNISEGNSAAVVIELENAIPVSGWFKIDMVDADNNLLFTISRNSNGTDTLFFESAPVNEEGEVIRSFQNPPITVTLDASQIEMLTRVKYAVYSASLQTSDAFQDPPTIVALRPSSWLRIRTYGTINYRIKPEEF
ncbi:hypothetical protein ACFLSH_01805 [Bacteroidota bacterium]